MIGLGGVGCGQVWYGKGFLLLYVLNIRLGMVGRGQAG